MLLLFKNTICDFLLYFVPDLDFLFLLVQMFHWEFKYFFKKWIAFTWVISENEFAFSSISVSCIKTLLENY